MNKTQEAIQVALQANIPVIAWGNPGVGKTSWVQSVAQGLKMPVEVVITSIREPQDFGGLPVYDPEKGVLLAPPAWAKRLSEKKRGIVFFDEISTAPPAVQAAMLRVTQDRVVGDMTLPEEVSILAAANPPSVSAGGWDLAPPMANRFCHIEWADPSVQEWGEGMMSGWPVPKVVRLHNNWRSHLPTAKSMVVSYLNNKRTGLFEMPKNEAQAGRAWASPRTWDMSCTLLSACIALYGKEAVTGAVNEVVSILVSGCVGSGRAMEFLTYVRELDLPDPEALLKNPDGLEIPSRMDKLYAILNSVTASILENNTPDRWYAGWFILEKVALDSAPDMATMSARILAQNMPKDAKIPVKQLKPFSDILNYLKK